MANYFQLNGAEPPWGDYGDILTNGLAEEHNLHGHRTVSATRSGPFVPPITLPHGHIFVTQKFRNKLLAEKFSGLAFKPVRYRKVVHIPWENWDWGADNPAYYPVEGKPENYLLEGTHDEQLEELMPRLWMWNIITTKCLQVQSTNSFRADRHPGTDVARDHYIIWISERVKTWLTENASDWVSFVQVVPR